MGRKGRERELRDERKKLKFLFVIQPRQEKPEIQEVVEARERLKHEARREPAEYS